MLDKAVLSIFILFFIPVLTSAFAKHDGLEEHNHSFKSQSGKCKLTDIFCYVCRVSQRDNDGLSEMVIEKIIADVPVESEV